MKVFFLSSPRSCLGARHYRNQALCRVPGKHSAKSLPIVTLAKKSSTNNTSTTAFFADYILSGPRQSRVSLGK
jgi:hypothetical protein